MQVGKMRKLHVVVAMFVLVLTVLVIVTCGGTLDNRPWTGSSGSIEGTIGGAAAGVSHGTRVTLDEAFEVLPGRNGAFSFPLVAPGTHLLEIESDAYQYYGKKWVEVAAGETVQVELELANQPEIGEVVGILTAEDIPDLDAISIQDITGYDDLVVLCDASRGFMVLDVSNISDPAYLGRNTDGRACESAVIEWPYIYTGWDSGSGGGIAVYSLEDRANPEKLSEIVTSNAVFAVDLIGDYLFALGDSSFQVFNISDPFDLSLTASLPLSGEGLTARGNYLYLSSNPEVLTVVDVTDPQNPQIADTSEEIEPDKSRDSFLDDKYAYVAVSSKVYLYDVRDPEDIRLLNVLDVAALESQGASLGGNLALEGLTVDNGILYMGAVSDGMVVVDYSDRNRPVFSWQTGSGVPFAMNVYVAGSYAHIAARVHGYRAVRIR